VGPRINKSKPIINIRHDGLLLLVHFLGKKTYAKLEVSQHSSMSAKSLYGRQICKHFALHVKKRVIYFKVTLFLKSAGGFFTGAKHIIGHFTSK
jgi:hypothetical protein